MLVAVTGGTGFVGSHAVAALLQRGHDVRLLVRSPAKVRPALVMHDLAEDDVEVAVADLADDGAIGEGLSGCDAVIHAASVFSLDPRRADEMATVNLSGMRSVIEHGRALGLDPIVHVSSVVALLRDDIMEHSVAPDAPIGSSSYPYSRSKADQEREARQHQDDGAPVVTVQPGGVWGPADPHLNESHQAVQAAVNGLYRTVPPGALAVCDVRDVAQVLARTVEPGRGPRRYSAIGEAVPLTDLVRTVTSAAGRPRRSSAVPDSVARAMERTLAALNRRGVAPMGATAEAIWVGRHQPAIDISRTEADLGVTFRPFEETVADQVAWMQAEGRL